MKQKLITTTYLNNKLYETYYNKYLGKSNNIYKNNLLYFNEFFININSKKKIKFYQYFFNINFTLVDYDNIQILTSNLLIKDMVNLNIIWRLIKGYSCYGQRTHSNNKKNKKNKVLHLYRLNQFFSLFGHRKRNIYPTLIIGEYTNKLWNLNWNFEWLQASLFVLKLSKQKINKVPFDPVSLAKNFTNGYIREGQASKLGKSKKITKVGTIGFPIFFSRWIYYDVPSRDFPLKLWISDSDRRKMGRKSKKNLKKKKK